MDANLFITAVIAGLTEALRLSFPERVNGAVTIAAAAVIGVLVAIVDTSIGLADISIAAGLMYGLGAAGITAALKKIG